MANRLILVAILLFILVAAGCSSVTPSVSTSTVSAATADTLPEGTQAAVLWTIDGKRAAFMRDTLYLSPGSHTISVLPRFGEARDEILAYAASAQARGINIRPITVEIEAGQELKLAALVRRHRSYSDDGSGRVFAPWQTTVLPYVVGDNAAY